MKNLGIFAGLWVFVLGSVSGAWAGSVETDHSLEINGKVVQYHLVQSMSLRAERQVTINHQEIRAFAPDTSITVLIGRDLDGDGKFDAWFYMGDEGIMESLEYPSSDQDGWDAAQVILKQHTKLENRWLAGIFWNWVTPKLSMAQSNLASTLKKTAMTEVELLDTDVRANRIEKMDPRAPELLPMRLTLSDGWAEIADSMNVRKEIALAVMDVAIWGGVVGKGLSLLKDGVVAVAKTSETLVSAGEVFERFNGAIKTRASTALEKFSALTRLSKLTAKAAVPYEFAKLAVSDRIAIIIDGLVARGQVGKLMARGIVTSGKWLGTGVKNIPYITWTQSLQVVSEVYNKRAILFNPNPYIVYKRVRADEDVMHDLKFMTFDSLATATIMDMNGNGLNAYLKAGVFSMLDSNGMNYLFTGKFDLKRNAIDTGWEAGVGNLQTLMDKASFRTFTNLSVKAKMPGLKLVGWVVSGIDQFLGYVAYANLVPDDTAKPEKSVAPLTITPVYMPESVADQK